jgi:hypothetical protein
MSHGRAEELRATLANDREDDWRYEVHNCGKYSVVICFDRRGRFIGIV